MGDDDTPDISPVPMAKLIGGHNVPFNWTIGFSAALASIVCGFLPWFVMAPKVALGLQLDGKIELDGMMHLMGVHFDLGLMALASGVIAVAGWLLQRRIVILIGSFVTVAIGAWLYVAWWPSLGEGVQAEWGLLGFGIAGSISLLSVLVVGPRMGEAAGRAEIHEWIYRKLNPREDDSKVVDTLIITLIAVNVLSVIVETEQAVAEEYATFFLINETLSTLIFSVEYFLRIWVCTLLPIFATGHAAAARIRYAFSMMALVDFIAIAPFFLSFIQMDLRIARAIRLMRLVRILKIGRYAHAVKTLGNVIARKKEELAIATFVTVMVLVLSASAMYFAEHIAQPEAFRSIPESMWWAVVTVTSVGYGDVSPVTGIGKVLGAVICMIGVLIVALPTGILASGFLEEMREQRRGKDTEVFGYCPHCGKQLMPDEELE